MSEINENRDELQLYGVNDACKMLHISEPTLRLELNAGRLSGRRIGKAKLVFTAEDIRNYIASLPNWKEQTMA